VNQKSREKLIITIGGIIAVLILYVAFFLMPSIDSIRLQKKQLHANKKNLAELKDILEEYQKYKQTVPRRFQGSLSAFAEQKAEELNVTISNIKPFGTKGEEVELKFDEIGGKKVLKFVYEMEKNGVQINSLNMKDYKGTGIWVVKMYLAATSAQ